MLQFGLKDALDIILVALFLFYLYKLMKESGTINIFLGTILDKVMSIGLIILVILFQDQIKRFLVELGNHNRWRFLSRMFSHHHGAKKGNQADARKSILAIVYACMSMSKSKTGALIVIQQSLTLDQYENTGDSIVGLINTRLIENVFFKNSPLHDGALIIAHDRVKAAGCILPVSHDTKIPRYMGLRHRSALGISQATDAAAIVVSEETGNISFAHKGKIDTRLSSTELEKRLSSLEYL